MRVVPDVLLQSAQVWESSAVEPDKFVVADINIIAAFRAHFVSSGIEIGILDPYRVSRCQLGDGKSRIVRPGLPFDLGMRTLKKPSWRDIMSDNLIQRAQNVSSVLPVLLLGQVYERLQVYCAL